MEELKAKKKTKMERETALFKECYNYIPAHQYGKGYEAFLAAYQEHPREPVYLYGLLLALILKSGLTAGWEWMTREKEISQHGSLLTRLARFLKNKPALLTARPAKGLYNLGLFLMEQAEFEGAGIFLQTCLLLEPGHTQALAAAGELALREADYSRGLNLFVQAARQAANRPDKPTEPE
jgi:tetratricopeptide (TPR) repeat protein